jgi:hypothetical protein
MISAYSRLQYSGRQPLAGPDRNAKPVHSSFRAGFQIEWARNAAGAAREVLVIQGLCDA